MLIEHSGISVEMQSAIKAMSLVRSVFNQTLLGMSMKRRQRFVMPSRKLRKQVKVVRKRIRATNVLEFGTGELNFIYLHGGGYHLRGGQNHFKFIRNFCLTKKVKVTFIDYPINTTYKETISKTNEILSELKFDAIIGDSAGGGLALSVDSDVPKFLFSPWMDLSMTNKDIDDSQEFMILKEDALKCARIYAGDLELDDPTISPLYKAPTSKITIYAGTEDILFHDMKLYEERYPEVILHTYEGLPHVFPILVGTQESMDVIQDIEL